MPMPSWTSQSPFLTGALEPVFDERDDVDLRVQGEIPPGLQGVFMRNGPNPRFAPDAHYSYPFDGTGMIHAVYLDHGRARYRNRWVMTQELAQEVAKGERIYNSTFSPPPHANLANTNVVGHGGRVLALYEGGLPQALSRELDTLGEFDYAGTLKQTMSAHPKVDPHTGELFSVQYDLDSGAMSCLTVKANGQAQPLLSFQSPWPAMVHDIALTENHVVACICPLVFDLGNGGLPADWQPERGSRFALIPRQATSAQEIRWVEGPPFFHWHVVNAYERDNMLQIVVPWYDSFSFTAHATRFELHRIVIDLRSGQVRDEVIDERMCEFGRINEAYLGREARYGYLGMRQTPPGQAAQPGTFEAIARYDLATGSKTVYALPPGDTVCEPVFVADPAGQREEDGFIFTFVQQAHTPTGRFCILDARDLAAGPIATVDLPRRVPAGLHGSWLAA